MGAVTLPYRTDWESMLDLLDYLKGSGADRAKIDARFGGGEPMRETLNALEQLGLIARADSGDIHLTNEGEELVYAPDESRRRRALAESLLRYQPYGIPIERAIGEGKDVIEAPWLEHIWQVDMRLGQPRNRVEEARTCFFRLAEAAGLGSYRRGVRGQASRLELAPTARSQVEGQLSRHPEPEQPEEPSGPSGQLLIPAPQREKSVKASLPAEPQVKLNLSIDLTEWDLEKIRELFELLEEFGVRGHLNFNDQPVNDTSGTGNSRNS